MGLARSSQLLAQLEEARTKAAEAARQISSFATGGLVIPSEFANLSVNPPTARSAKNLVRNIERRGDKHREQRAYAQAIECFRQVIAAEPNNAVVLNRLAWLLAIGPKEVRDADEALAFSQRACQQEPNNPYYLNTLGAVHFRLGNSDESLRCSKQVADANPHNFPWQTHNLLLQALCHEQLGDRPAAQATYDQALELLKQANDREMHWHEARLLQDEVEELLVPAEKRRKVIEAKNLASWNIVSDPKRSAEQYAEALRLAIEVTQQQPEVGYYLNTLGVAQYRVGQFQQAIESLTRSEALNAKQIGSPHPVDVAFLAMAHHRLGNTEKAQEFLARTRELLKDKRWSTEAGSKASLAEAAALIEKPSGP